LYHIILPSQLRPSNFPCTYWLGVKHFLNCSIIIKNLVPTSNKTPRFTITDISWLAQFGK
jgi:hypothetical protein